MNVLNASKQFLTKNSTTILMGLGAVTAVSSVAMAIKETPKAITKMYEKAKEIDPDTPIESVLYPRTDLYDKIGWKETLKSTWKCYIPTVLLAGTSLTCFFAAMHITSGGYLGWSADRLMDISFDSMIAPNGEPCIVLNYLVQPSVNFKK